MDITEKLLIDNGFEKIAECGFYNGDFHGAVFRKTVPHETHYYNYYLTIRDESNTPYRDWSIQVDNETHMTCGGIDLQTVEHFNTFMDLLDLDFKL